MFHPNGAVDTDNIQQTILLKKIKLRVLHTDSVHVENELSWGR